MSGIEGPSRRESLLNVGDEWYDRGTEVAGFLSGEIPEAH